MLNERDLPSAAGGRRMLHVAPEPVLEQRLRAKPAIDYHRADVQAGAAQEQMDITAIRHPDGSFDVIYCSHACSSTSPTTRRRCASCAASCTPTAAAGFTVRQDRHAVRIGPVRSRRYGLHPVDVVHLCTRR
jgi:hypothetical protein